MADMFGRLFKRQCNPSQHPDRTQSVFAAYRATPAYLENRHDRRTIVVQPGLELEIFWKDISGYGRGPACSVLIEGEEILKLDCFGPGIGHLHADFISLVPGGEDRLFFYEDSVAKQIDRSLFEIRRNLSYYQARSPWAAARTFRTDPEKLEAAVIAAGDLMREYARTNHPIS